MQLESSRESVQELIDSFVSFQLCGPSQASAVRLNGQDHPVEVLASNSDWSFITKGRPVTDCRASSLQDLMPRTRDVLRSLAEYKEEKALSMRMG